MTDEAFIELIKAVIVAIDLHGIDIKKSFPKLWEEYLNLKKGAER